MIAETICVPISNNLRNISLSSFRDSSSGTDYAFIQHGGESIRVRVDQLWFWSEEWQKGENKVDEYIREGNVQTFDTEEEFLRTLRE
jgi:hypothetical protein